ncbi:ADP-ribosylglycohydrolase family protein [Actinomadura keratinilytica]|uniref:ADP-ribosylglycohydrolase family protein n=1 Tax=Actinomadura keratinilytica TaxID=547461 RepID=A0ABP7YHJ1_9ACTN
MPVSTTTRQTLALDSLTGLSVGDAFGERGFEPHLRVTSPTCTDGRWPWTDDTQMACSVLDVLTRFGEIDQTILARAFAERAEPHRNYGYGAIQLIDGIRRGGEWRALSRGLFKGSGSWGNGGAMRIAPLGAWFHDDLDRAAAQAAAASEVTHAHPEGVAGAVAIAVAAAHAAAARGGTLAGPELIDTALAHVTEGYVHDGLRRAKELLDRPAAEVAAELGNGSQISAPDTVPFALWTVATRLDDYPAALRTCVEVGGDMDTMAAIVGGVIAAHHGTSCIPEEWLEAREPLPGWLWS